MKAIDRAARWTEELERVGFDIEAETDEMIFSEFMTVTATKGKTRVRFTIRMDTKYTRFLVGSVGFCGVYTRTSQPSKMACLVFSEIEAENYKARMAVAS